MIFACYLAANHTDGEYPALQLEVGGDDAGGISDAVVGGAAVDHGRDADVAPVAFAPVGEQVERNCKKKSFNSYSYN